MGLGDKASAFALTEQAMAALPIEKDAVFGPIPIEILARVAAQMGEPDRAIAALQKLLRSRTLALSLRARSLLRCSGSIRCSIRFGTIRVSKNSPPRPRRTRISDAAKPHLHVSKPQARLSARRIFKNDSRAVRFLWQTLLLRFSVGRN